MTARKPPTKPMTAAEFREHAQALRRTGATRVHVTQGNVTHEVEYPSPTDKTPAVGGTVGFVYGE